MDNNNYIAGQQGGSSDERAETNIFDDLKPQPVYYSERAIYAFSVLLGVLFGSVLVAMNFNNTEGKRGKWQVIVFGILFTVVEVSIPEILPRMNSSLTFLFNLAGAYILMNFFWAKYIGKDVSYTKRSVVVPAIIGIVLAILLILAVVVSLSYT